jgi:succinate dehydrogenase flavin-adding protein (antitoxin of CptAB toxin-antitoxin module)
VVSVPVGLDEQFLDPQAVNFDDNDWNIKQADGATTPNITLSHGIDENYITEPGKYGNPYVKTGNGSINVSGINYADSNDTEIAPFSKILEDLAQLSKIPANEQSTANPASADHGKKLTVSDYKKIRNAELTRKLLNEMMKTKCPGDPSLEKERKQKFVVSLGELELDPLPVDENGEPLKWDETNKVWVNSKGDWILPPTDLGVLGTGKDEFKVGLGDLEMWDPEMQAWINSKGEKRYEDGFNDKVVKDVSDALKDVNSAQKDNMVSLGELQLWDNDMQAWINPEGEKTYEKGFKDNLVQGVRDALETNGMQTTITNGMEGIKNMENSDRGLFDQ